MFATNTLKVTENQENSFYSVIEKKLIKLGFEDKNTFHFSFMGTRLNIVNNNMCYQALYEFGNGDDFFHISIDLNKNKTVKIKTLTLENQN
tara:strand:- start:1323 stop:1595 length:273 start_codon:yes stop_codon:yes gene_type:complete